jgi:hypothetical protein
MPPVSSATRQRPRLRLGLRLAIVVLAALAVAWLGTGIAANRAQGDLAELVIHADRPRPAELRRGAALADRAERFTPDQRPALLLATLHLKAGDDAGAERVLAGVVRREPENAEAWLLLSRAAARRDPALAARARQRVRELAPSVPRP